MRKIKWTDTELAFHQNPVFEAMMNIQKNYNKQVEDIIKEYMNKRGLTIDNMKSGARQETHNTTDGKVLQSFYYKGEFIVGLTCISNYSTDDESFMCKNTLLIQKGNWEDAK